MFPSPTKVFSSLPQKLRRSSVSTSSKIKLQCMNDSSIQKKRCYRLLSELPNIRKSENTPQKRTEEIIRSGKFVYIDVNECKRQQNFVESGLKAMQEIDIEDVDLDAENIGNSVICSLQNSSLENQRTMDYIYRANDLRKQKEKFDSLMKKKEEVSQTERKMEQRRNLKLYEKNRSKRKKQQFGFLTEEQAKRQKTEQKMRKKAFVSLSTHRNEQKQQKVVESVEQTIIRRLKSQNAPILYHGMRANKLKQILQRKEMEKINSQILQKQKELIRSFGLLGEEEVEKKQQSLVRTRRKKNSQCIFPTLSIGNKSASSNLNFQ